MKNLSELRENVQHLSFLVADLYKLVEHPYLAGKLKEKLWAITNDLDYTSEVMDSLVYQDDYTHDKKEFVKERLIVEWVSEAKKLFGESAPSTRNRRQTRKSQR
jgi:hypothetical protein